LAFPFASPPKAPPFAVRERSFMGFPPLGRKAHSYSGLGALVTQRRPSIYTVGSHGRSALITSPWSEVGGDAITFDSPGRAFALPAFPLRTVYRTGGQQLSQTT